MSIRDNLGGGSAGSVLDTLEEIEANTEAGKAAGALAVKELNDSLNSISGFIPFVGNNKITIPISTTTYTATQDGWLNIIGQGKNTSGSARIIDVTLDNGFSNRAFYQVSSDAKTAMKLALPMKKGQTVTITLIEATITSITFFY